MPPAEWCVRVHVSSLTSASVPEMVLCSDKQCIRELPVVPLASFLYGSPVSTCT